MGESDRDKHNIITSWTFDQFTEARAKQQHITTQTLQQWGMAASFQFKSPVFPFNTSSGWVKDFKNYKIRHRQVTKYVSSKDNATFEETVWSAELFQKQLQ
jgi:hypothetical protein